uniref:Uncharacterized protein n=1 Tax=Klebsiella pneumoniae TaxID=573 RepID=A0A9J6S6Q4_KLEPN|nr:hypothetical protein [Klebsiella pneumoniae]
MDEQWGYVGSKSRRFMANRFTFRDTPVRHSFNNRSTDRLFLCGHNKQSLQGSSVRVSDRPVEDSFLSLVCPGFNMII